jgi:UDP-2,3-diacylglucosamine pyrophosphatase LpxH
VQGCSSLANSPDDPDFHHQISGDVLPWTNDKFDSEDDRFTFAIFSDLTGDERDRVFEIAVAQLALLRPEFIINVGDLIEGGTEDASEIHRQWASFDERAERANAPLFYVGGNHDLNNIALRDAWDARYGPSYYHFVYRDTLFLVLDTEDNTPARIQEMFRARAKAIKVLETEGWDAFVQTEYFKMPEHNAGSISAEQSQYFQDVIAANPNVRWTFLFMHKAPWKREDMSTFAAIEAALEDRPYTVFNGHVQAYEHQVRRGRDYIRLATTGGFHNEREGLALDHVTLVTVSQNGVDIANLKMGGILDKTGHIPLDGDDVCFDPVACREAE